MTNLEPYPNLEPGRVEPASQAAPSLLAEAQDREQRRWDRIRIVRVSCTIINVICGLFAAVLAAHIIMVMGEANPANGIAAFVRGWAGGVSLGLDDLFTPDNDKLRVLFNNGLAAIAWLALGAVTTTLIRRLALLPGPRRLTRRIHTF